MGDSFILESHRLPKIITPIVLVGDEPMLMFHYKTTDQRAGRPVATGFKRAVCHALFLGVIAALVWTTGTVLGQTPIEPVVRYDGHKLIRVQINSAEDLAFMLRISPDVWSGSASEGFMDFRIPPSSMPRLESSQLQWEELIRDIQPLIDAERANENLAEKGWYHNFRTYSEITLKLKQLIATRPDIASLHQVGMTHDNQVIQGVYITSPNPGKRPGVLISACQHGREWIAPMVGVYIVEKLITGYGVDPAVTAMIDNRDWFIIPIVNVDGYLYTWTTNRLWRKNRRDNGDGTFGVDLNRNWAYKWGGVGSSGMTSSDHYRGPAPFSEPETACVRDIMATNPQLIGYIDIHSYGQSILSPWGCAATATPDHAFFQAFGKVLAGAIYGEYGENYQVGAWHRLLYPASGVSIDWAYAVMGVISYNIELRDRGQYGYLLPSNQIIPTAEEIWAAIKG